MSSASISKRDGSIPASSSAIAAEYGSSPVEHGALRIRNARAGSAKRRCAPSRASAANASRSRKNQVSGTTNNSISARRSSADAFRHCQYASTASSVIAGCGRPACAASPPAPGCVAAIRSASARATKSLPSDAGSIPVSRESHA
ncbi:chemotaxis receptor methyltransferase domain protein [Burkholderia pseudomallei]|nr:chemotaxis receptor methyltransferase domain protein [Burkholderia pseudomallei]